MLVLAFPPLLFVGGMAAISGFYFWKLGHLPDWKGFYEYALIYGGGFGALSISPLGSVWTLLYVFCIILAVGSLLFQKGQPGLALVLGAVSVLWSTGSYFVSRSHEKSSAQTSLDSGLLPSKTEALKR